MSILTLHLTHLLEPVYSILFIQYNLFGGKQTSEYHSNHLAESSTVIA